MKYRLLNIFYNREAEIEILKKTWAKEEDEQIKRKRPGKKYKEWLKKFTKKSFNKFLYQQKSWNADTKPQTWNKKNPYFEALEMFNELMEEINSFDLPVQKKAVNDREKLGKVHHFLFC